MDCLFMKLPHAGMSVIRRRQNFWHRKSRLSPAIGSAAA
jgi:hypothetical protein